MASKQLMLIPRQKLNSLNTELALMVLREFVALLSPLACNKSHGMVVGGAEFSYIPQNKAAALYLISLSCLSILTFYFLLFYYDGQVWR